MPLIKATLARDLESIFAQKPATAATAAAAWAKAYVAYAGAALSKASGLPVTATAMQATLVSAFTSALQPSSAQGAGALMAQGVTAFWSAMVWIGPTAAGTTAFPGNATLSSALTKIFNDTSQVSDADKANALADAFDAGAKLVIVNDIPFVQPPATIVGPIS